MPFLPLTDVCLGWSDPPHADNLQPGLYYNGPCLNVNDDPNGPQYHCGNGTPQLVYGPPYVIILGFNSQAAGITPHVRVTATDGSVQEYVGAAGNGPWVWVSVGTVGSCLAWGVGADGTVSNACSFVTALGNFVNVDFRVLHRSGVPLLKYYFAVANVRHDPGAAVSLPYAEGTPDGMGRITLPMLAGKQYFAGASWAKRGVIEGADFFTVPQRDARVLIRVSYNECFGGLVCVPLIPRGLGAIVI